MGRQLREPPAAAPAATAPAAGSVPGPVYPVGLVLAGRPVLLVGGGSVAERKLPGLLRCGARVTVVAPQVRAGLVAGAASIERRPYRRGELAGYRLAVAATGRREVDRQVFEDGEAANVLVNAADEPLACSAVLPAVWRCGEVTVSVSTGGRSPALAAWLRDRAAEALGDDVGELALLLGSARAELHARGRSTEGLAWRGLAAELAGLLARGEREAAARSVGDFVAAALPLGTLR